jgi:hypothetical protein
MNKVPEKIYFKISRRAIEYIEWMGLDKKEPGDNIEYIRADLVEPSYGAEKIIRGNGKIQDEYILKSIADKRVADAIKPIVEVYEKYTGSHKDILEKAVLTVLELDFLQAIKATVKQLKINET